MRSREGVGPEPSWGGEGEKEGGVMAGFGRGGITGLVGPVSLAVVSTRREPQSHQASFLHPHVAENLELHSLWGGTTQKRQERHLAWPSRNLPDRSLGGGDEPGALLRVQKPTKKRSKATSL